MSDGVIERALYDGGLVEAAEVFFLIFGEVLQTRPRLLGFVLLKLLPGLGRAVRLVLPLCLGGGGILFWRALQRLLGSAP